MTPETRTRVDVLKTAAEALVAAADDLVDRALELETAEFPPGTRVQHSEAPIGNWDGRGTVIGPHSLSGHVLVDWDNMLDPVGARIQNLTPIPQRSWVCGNHAVETDFDRGPEDYNRVEMFDPDSYPPQDNEAARRSQEVKGNPYPTFNEWAKANADV